MRIWFLVFLFAANCVSGQQGLQVEIMPGVAGYQGDLTQKTIPFNTIGPSAALNVKYDFGDMVILRTGFAWGKVSADDKDNSQSDINNRNLNFKTTIWEGHLGAEVNILDPEFYNSLPYLFTGIALYRFNPYTYDKDNVKTYLHPLNTEGQGLQEYPDRKKYKLVQFCVPFGGGWKLKINDKYAFGVEIGVRLLFTDYLDDVSETYVNPQILFNRKGAKSLELAFRETPMPAEGIQRGNAGKNDMYGFAGVKFAMRIGKVKE